MFTDIFSELLAERNLNRKQFAEKSGIPYTTVIGWTTLNRLPDYTALVKIADFFDCSIDFLAERGERYELGGTTELKADERGLLKGYRRLRSDNKALVAALVSALAAEEK